MNTREPAPAAVARAEVARIPWRATQALIADALGAAGLPAPDAARCAELMTASRSHRRRRPRHFPPAAICPPAQGARLQRAAEHRGVTGGGRHRARRRR
jgi:hypothetical protein